MFLLTLFSKSVFIKKIEIKINKYNNTYLIKNLKWILKKLIMIMILVKL